jgi:hypothetical protein
MGIVTLMGSPREETKSGEVVVKGTESMSNEGRGKSDKELLAEGIEI